MEKNNKNQNNKKKYDHIAVGTGTKNKFEKERFKLIGKEKKEITQDDMVNILLDKWKN